MHAQPAVLGAEIGMIGPAGAARVGEDEDALLVVHEGLRLGEIGRAGAVFNAEAVRLPDDAARAAGDLGDLVGAETLHDLVERAGDRRQRGQPLDHPVASLDSLPALHRLAVAIDRPGRQIALAVGEGLEELGRKGVQQVVEDVFARRDVDRDVAPFLARDFGKTAFHQRLAGRDDLDDRGMAGGMAALDRADQGRRLHRRDQVIEEALLGALEGRARGRFGLGVQGAGGAGDVRGFERRV